MANSAEYKSKSAVLHRLWWRLQMNEKFSSWTKPPNKQTNKQTKVIVDFFSLFYGGPVDMQIWVLLIRS